MFFLLEKKMKLKKKIIHFCKNNTGSVAITMALMLPAIIGLHSLAIDGARFNAERSRLTDSLNQSVYAIALVNNKNLTGQNKRENIQVAGSYLGFYLPYEEIDEKKISVTSRDMTDSDGKVTMINYHVNADQIVHPVFTLLKSSGGGFSQNVTLRGNGLSGNVRRAISSSIIPGDYVFVLDFSGSMSDLSDEPHMTREELLKSAVYQIGSQILKQGNGSKIGIIPFSDGVPVKLNKADHIGPISKEYGCSFIGKFKKQYEGINWDFWYNKPGDYNNFIASGDVDSFALYSDEALRDYYVNTVAAANGYYGYEQQDAIQWLIYKGYCRIDRAMPHESSEYRYDQLLCDADSDSDIHNKKNKREFLENIHKFSDVVNFENKNRSILNEDVMDINGTLQDDYLFKSENIQNVISFKNKDRFTPFNATCNDASPSWEYQYNNPHRLGVLYNATKPVYYTIDLSDNINVLNEYKEMTPNGGTNTLAGLLRAVPMLAKGKNTQKTIFVISDGEDNFPEFRRKLMRQYHLCDVIRDGLKKYPEGTNTKYSDIYYISLIKSDTAREWADICVGQGNSFIATDLDSLIDAISSAIPVKETIQYVNPEENYDYSLTSE